MHSEAGVGDWASGKGLSRLSIDGGALAEQKESNDGLRHHSCKVMAPSVDRVIARGKLAICPIDQTMTEPRTITIPCKIRHCGDFKFHQNCAGQRTGTHPVFCDCDDVQVLE
jgi:hypothetical protein